MHSGTDWWFYTSGFLLSSAGNTSALTEVFLNLSNAVEYMFKFSIPEFHYRPNSHLMHCRESESVLFHWEQTLVEVSIHKMYGTVSCPKLLCSLF